MRGDLQMFLNGEELAEYKMVHDALAAAEVLRDQPGIDAERIAFAGESNAVHDLRLLPVHLTLKHVV